MSSRIAAPLLVILALTACGSGTNDPVKEAPNASDAASHESGVQSEPIPMHTAKLRGRVVEFLRRQDPVWKAIEIEQLDHVDAVSLRDDYTTTELARLSTLPALTTLRIVRTGERFGQPTPRPAPTNDDLEVIAGITGLEKLQIGGWNVPYTSAGLAHLSGLTKLRDLSLFQAPEVTDEALDHIARISSLERLDVTYTKVSDVGLAKLLELPRLTIVRFGWAAESRRALARFRAAHPDAGFTIEP